MTESSPLPRRARMKLCCALLVLLGFLVSAVSSEAQTCDRSGCGRSECGTPARPAPADRWVDLEPTDVGTIPRNRDTTYFDQSGKLTSNVFDLFSWFMSVDVENGFVIAALAHGIQVWDARTTPGSPLLMGQAKGGYGGNAFPIWVNDPHVFFPLYDVDAPPGKDDVAAIVGEGQVGLSIFDLSDKTAPVLRYQSYKKDMRAVYATTIGGVDYAFGAAYTGEPSGGLFAYNMTAARQSNRCVEAYPAIGEPQSCPGVYVGKLGSLGSVYYVDGVDQFVVASSGGYEVEILDVTNPGNAQQKLKARNANKELVYGVALWAQGGKYYLALLTSPELRIYDVSCITGTCAGLGAPIATVPTNLQTREQTVTFSRSGSTPFLYVGSDQVCNDGSPQREFLLDVSNPASPRNIGGASYWDWYYRTSPTGFNLFTPRAAKFYGQYLYRAGNSLLDVHKLRAAGPPQAEFSWSPAEVYPGMPVNFKDESIGGATQWTWTFPAEASVPLSSSQNPAGVQFTTNGPFPADLAVTLVSGNSSGLSSPRTKNVRVIDPAPQVGSIAVSPANPYVCQPITFTAQNATGRPPLGFAWTITRDGVTAPVKTGSGTAITWTETGTATPGPHTASVEVTNGVGQKATKSAAFTLNPLPALPAAAGFAPTCSNCTNGSPPSGTVNLAVNVPGATEWCWDFGDGSTYPAGCVNNGVFGAFTNDPVNGPATSHVYTTTGQKTITVYVKNCVEAPRGGSVAVNITQTEPLTAAFHAVSGVFCSGIGCSASANQPITFEDSSTGAETWDFDWNGDGFGGPDDQMGLTPSSPAFTIVEGKRQIQHTYSTTGAKTPKLRVRRGSEVNEFTHSRISISGGGNNNPTITVSGPPTGKVNVGQTFTAAGGGSCSPNASGWSWTTSGGTVTGADNAGSITVSWSTTGLKSVQATNSACPGVTSNSASINISQDNNQGGPLAAVFSWTPQLPKAGETVSFNGSASTGAPEGYEWSFGDGTKASGALASHSYAAPGSYSVRLSIRKAGSGPGCLFNVCLAEKIETITVVPSGPVLNPAFTTNAACETQFGFEVCKADTGKAVTLTATEADAAYTWDFGDGQTGSGRTVNHAWASPGSYAVSLTVSKGGASGTTSKAFKITGAVVATGKTVVLPWIAQSRAPLLQSSDLYLHNPSGTAMEVTLELRKRGLSEINPPRVKRTIAPGATLFASDVLRDVFNRENSAGFINVTVDKGDAEPIITSFNTTYQSDGSEFGQSVPGISMSRTDNAATAPSTTRVQHLVGLNDNSDRVAYFGVTNPSDQQATYRLRFFDSDGKPVGKGEYQLTLSRYGQKQYQPKELREQFGVHNVDDFRIEIETTAGGQLFPFGASLRLGSEDPSYVGTGSRDDSKTYLIGALSAKGLNNSLWQTDLVVSNTSGEVVLTEVTFTGSGVTAQTTAPLKLTLQPGETQRLANILNQWNLRDAVGVLTLDSDAAGSVFPIAQGESYENTQPTRRFGQTIAAMSERQAAGPNQGHYLVGLRQNAKTRTTLWLFNPSGQAGDYDVVYRGLDGKELGRIQTKLAPGKLRQLSPNQHPLPKSGVEGGFTVQVLVKSGKVLATAQVINNATNDPAFIQGATR